MAAADYRLCDVCDGKVFYDANLNYERGRDDEWAKRKAPFRWAGEEQGKPENDDWLLRLDYLGDWAVICNDCAKTHKTIVVPIDAQIEHLRAALIAAMEIVQKDRLVLYRTALDPRTETVTDLYSLAALADYDRVIAQADAALGSER